MVKRKNKEFLSLAKKKKVKKSDDDSPAEASTKKTTTAYSDSDTSSGSDDEWLELLEFLSQAEKKKVKKSDDDSPAEASTKKTTTAYSDSDTSSGSDDDWDAKGNKNANKKKKKTKSAPKRTVSKSTAMKSDEEEPEKNNKSSEPEEGEVSDSDDSDSDSSDSQEEFNDGYDENLMGDEEDQRRLAQMTEKEREQEIFKQIEQREVMKTRFEIEKKLQLAKKQEMKKKKGSTAIKKKEERMDPKERSKERKKTVEENRGKVDKKAQAMNLLKARREEKKEREEKEKQQKIEQEKKKEDEEKEREREEGDRGEEGDDDDAASSKPKLKEELQEKVKQLAINSQGLLECPVCFNPMDATLTQCINGHGICRSCTSKVEECPTCKQELSKVCQNTLLGQLLELLPKPCPYADDGCDSVVFDEEHAKYCQFRTTECRVTSCTWSGCVKDLLDHLKKTHKSKLWFMSLNTARSITCTFPDNSFKLFSPIIFGSNIFWLCCHRNLQKKCTFHNLYSVPTSKPTADYFMVVTFKNDDIKFYHTCKATTDIEDDDESVTSCVISNYYLEYFKIPEEIDKYSCKWKMVKKDLT